MCTYIGEASSPIGLNVFTEPRRFDEFHDDAVMSSINVFLFTGFGDLKYLRILCFESVAPLSYEAKLLTPNDINFLTWPVLTSISGFFLSPTEDHL